MNTMAQAMQTHTHTAIKIEQILFICDANEVFRLYNCVYASMQFFTLLICALEALLLHLVFSPSLERWKAIEYIDLSINSWVDLIRYRSDRNSMFCFGVYSLYYCWNNGIRSNEWICLLVELCVGHFVLLCEWNSVQIEASMHGLLYLGEVVFELPLLE